MSELRLLHNNLSLRTLRISVASVLHDYYFMFLGCTCFKVTFPFTQLLFTIRDFFYSFVSLCFLVLDHEAVPDLSLSVSLKSSMIMGTGLQIRLFLHDFYTRFLYTIV